LLFRLIFLLFILSSYLETLSLCMEQDFESLIMRQQPLF
jgi:hypothetical protein